jgi:hypothetical protein
LEVTSLTLIIQRVRGSIRVTLSNEQDVDTYKQNKLNQRLLEKFRKIKSFGSVQSL